MGVYQIKISEVFEDFLRSKKVTKKEVKLIEAKIKTLSKMGKSLNSVKELKNTDGLFRLKAGRFRIIFFFDNEGNIIIVTNGFIKKSKKDYKWAIDTAIKIKGKYYNN